MEEFFLKWLPFQKLPFDQPSALAAPSSMAGLLAKGMPDIRRMVQQHTQMRQAMCGNFLAPLATPGTILDVGCNNGRWAMEMAVQFPSAQVIGIDPTLPSPFLNLGSGIEHKPSNVDFLQVNLGERLPFSDAMFDFVHMRFLYTSVPTRAWEPLMRELVRVTHPGGWVESVEPLPYAVAQKEGVSTILGWFCEWLRQQGADPLAALKITSLMKAVGLENINTCQIGQLTSDTQDAEETALRRDNGMLFIDLVRGPLVATGITASVEYERVATIARAELQGNQLPSCFNTYVNWGQRPSTL
jgi:ubiquinone/menaquinone biosynthesis C-methylase UbiE